MGKKATDRVKAILAEKNVMDRWLAEKLGKMQQQFRDGLQVRFTPITTFEDCRKLDVKLTSLFNEK